jgi:5-methylcytosine-specific restriction endonuclease McrA
MAPSLEKTCQKCKRRKRRLEFRTLDGTGRTQSPCCRSCEATVASCKACGPRPITHFTHQSASCGFCTACYSEIRRTLYGKRRDQIVEEARSTGTQPREHPAYAHYSQDPAVALRRPKRLRAERERNAKRGQIDRELIFERDGWRCYLCGELVERCDATLDHVVPLALGGVTEPGNLRLAHQRCNSKRGGYLAAGREPPDLGRLASASGRS